MVQTRARISINTQVNSTNPYPSENQETYHLRNWNKPVFCVAFTTSKWEKYLCIMMENLETCLFQGTLFISKKSYRDKVTSEK